MFAAQDAKQYLGTPEVPLFADLSEEQLKSVNATSNRARLGGAGKDSFVPGKRTNEKPAVCSGGGSGPAESKRQTDKALISPLSMGLSLDIRAVECTSHRDVKKGRRPVSGQLTVK